MGTFVQSESQHVQEHILRSQMPAVKVPDDLTLPEFVLKDAKLYADNVAFVEAVSGKKITYREVARDTARFAKALRSLGLRKGHVVIVVLPNVAEYAIVALGIMAAGGVFSGANPAGHASEIKKQIVAADAKLVVTDGASYEKVKGFWVAVIGLGEEIIEGAMNWYKLLEAADRAGISHYQEKVQHSDLCALPFSSGTTGISKGVMLTHRNLVANLSSTLFGVTQEMLGKVTVLGLIPVFHIYGITGICCATLRNKGKVVVMGRYELRTFLNALIAEEVTFAPIVPPIILNLVKHPVVDEFDLSKLKLQAVMTAAAPLAPELLKAFETKFPGVQVQEAYGLTEHSCITLTHAGQGFQSKPNSVGFILPNMEVKFIDPETGRSLPRNTRGEICVLSPCTMQATLEKMGKKSEKMVPNTLAKMLAGMRRATHLMPDGDSVKPSSHAAIMMVPPADQDGRTKTAGADVPIALVPQGKEVTLEALADSSVPLLNPATSSPQWANTGRSSPKVAGRGSTKNKGPMDTEPARKRPVGTPTEKGGQREESSEPKQKKAKVVSSWFESTSYDPSNAKSGESTTLLLPLFKPSAVEGFNEFAQHTLTKGVKEGSNLAVGAALLVHAASSVFNFACSENQLKEDLYVAKSLRRKLEKEQAKYEKLIAETHICDAELEELRRKELELEGKHQATLQEVDALKKELAQLKIDAAAKDETLSAKDQDLLAKDKSLEKMGQKISQHPSAIDAAKAEGVAEYVNSAAFLKEQRMLKKVFYQRGAAHNISCLQHLGLLDFDRYCDSMNDPEVSKGLPVDPAEAEFASSDGEEDSEEENLE